MLRLQCLALLLCLTLTCATAQDAELILPGLSPDSPATPDPAPAAAETAVAPPSKAEQLFRKAIAIRDSSNPGERELKRAVELLYAAAGIEHLSIEARSPAVAGSAAAAPATAGEAEEADDTHGFLTSADVKVVWRNGTVHHVKAVKELIYVFREGDGAPYNPAIAHRLLIELASVGDTEAQTDVAFSLAQGVDPVAPNTRDQLFRLRKPDLPAALAYYYFAAKAGDSVAQMTLAYRHLYGLGVPKSCQTAVLYYLPVAERVLELAKQPDSLPQLRPFRLSHASAHSHRSRPSAEQEFLHYQWFADYGHADAARAVAHLLSHGAARDHGAAVQYLLRAADAGDADAMAHLGHMHANGMAVPRNVSAAWKWFWLAAERGHASGMLGLGYMHLTGLGAEVDHKQAFHYFRQAVEAGQDWSGMGDALFFLATMHLKGLGTRADPAQASALYTAAAAAGNLLAAYNLAVLHLRGMAGEAKGPGACRIAVAQLKRVAERAWPALPEANDDFVAGDYHWALLNYLKAGEWGSEPAQSNAAWMLSEGYGYEGARAGVAAVALLRRAAEQGNTAALLRLGDSYWYGKGVRRDWTRAGRVYSQAARHRLPQALFNLGFMHQHGAGAPKDLHLAKRYYDGAAASGSDAHLPATLALGWLKVQGAWERWESVLPRRWAALVTRLFVVKEPAAGVGGGGGGRKGGGVNGGRRRSALTLGWVDALDVLDDSLDSALLLWLGGMLALVLWRRRNLRVRAQQVQQVGQRAVPQQQQQAPAAAAVQPVERQGERTLPQEGINVTPPVPEDAAEGAAAAEEQQREGGTAAAADTEQQQEEEAGQGT